MEGILPNPHADKPKTDMTVVITATSGNGGGIDYQIDGKPHHTHPKLELPKDSGPYKIRFKLDTKLDLRFDAAKPFYCIKDEGCCPDRLGSEQVMVDRCDKKELVVVDWNYGEPQDLRYQINFVDACGAAKEPLDPIIQNGGGIKPGNE